MGAGPLACAVAGHGLGDHDGRYPSEPLDDDAWHDLRAAVIGERLPPLMAAAVDDGAFPVTEKQWSQVEADQKTAMKAAVDLDRHLVHTIGELSGVGVETRALKGASSAYLAYPDPSSRAYGDIDLLVRAEDLGRAVGELEDAGGTRRYLEPRPGFDREFSKGVCVVTMGKQEIDLHRSLTSGPFGQMIDLAALFEIADELQVGGATINVLSAEGRLVHAAYHAVLGSTPPRLVALRDLAQLVLSGDDTVEGALSLARSWGGEVVMAMALREAWRTLGPDDRPSRIGWAQRYEPSRADARRLRAYMGPTRSTARQSVETFLVLPGLGARWRYARAVALPDQSRSGRAARWRGVVGR